MISKRRIVHLLGSLLALIALAYFGRTIAHYWSQTSDLLRQPAIAWALCLSLPLLATGYLLSAAGWQQICRALGISLRPSQAIRIYFVSQFGKYLPGNVAQHAGRLTLSMRQGFPGTAVAMSQLLEITLVMMVMGVLVLLSGTATLVEWRLDLARIAPWKIGLALLAMLILAWLTLRVPHLLARIRQSIALVRTLLTTRRGVGQLTAATVLVLANIVATSAALHLIATCVHGEDVLPSFLHTCRIFIVAWLAGYITPGSPAGLGVREAVMLKLFSESMTETTAVTICLIFRIATTLTDLLVFAIGWRLPTHQRHAVGRS